MAQQTLPPTYKGLAVRLVPRREVGFGYEIQSRGRALASSQGAFVTRAAAFAAACQFIDEVDRRMGLEPSGGRA